jgi:cytochrome c peroxidase
MKTKLLSFSILFIALIGFSGTIDLNNLFDYANQTKPNYITKDNTANNVITDAGATLGRVLFYDKKLSSNNTISCSSCHQQQFAFGDTSQVSTGVNGVTGRHSMRLVNSRFATESRFFWDERAATLEMQTTMPIKDHGEMGYSGTNGDGEFNDLLIKLDTVGYYNHLFFAAFGDTIITENRIQLALAQFIRSIQSFDSKYDVGRSQVNNDGQAFPNFTQQENNGKQLFLNPPNNGGAGCAGCHRPPEFDIDPNTQNNGVIDLASGLAGTDFTNTRSPSLRDLVNPLGQTNGGMMHTGTFNSLMEVINHYNAVPVNPTLDNRLRGANNQGQQLNLTQQNKGALVAFLRTLTGNDVYTNPKWSNPFDINGNLTILGSTVSADLNEVENLKINVFPNPATTFINIEFTNAKENETTINIIDMSGKMVYSEINSKNLETHRLDLNNLSNGIYLVNIFSGNTSTQKKIIIRK